MLTMDHYICLYSIMVSSHQFHTWEQEPLLLSIRFHVLFSTIPYMKKGSQHVWNWCEKTMVLYRQIEWSTKTVWSHVWTWWKRDHGVVYTDSDPWSHGLLHTNSIHETTDHSIYLYTTPWSLASSNHETMDHCLSIQHHGLLPIPYMRPWTTIYMVRKDHGVV
jgi:hypothetical protein